MDGWYIDKGLIIAPACPDGDVFALIFPVIDGFFKFKDGGELMWGIDTDFQFFHYYGCPHGRVIEDFVIAKINCDKCRECYEKDFPALIRDLIDKIDKNENEASQLTIHFERCKGGMNVIIKKDDNIAIKKFVCKHYKIANDCEDIINVCPACSKKRKKR